MKNTKLFAYFIILVSILIFLLAYFVHLKMLLGNTYYLFNNKYICTEFFCLKEGDPVSYVEKSNWEAVNDYEKVDFYYCKSHIPEKEIVTSKWSFWDKPSTFGFLWSILFCIVFPIILFRNVEVTRT